MYCNKNRVEFIKYCSLIKAMITTEDYLISGQSLFENISYENHSVKNIHQNKFDNFCKVNLNLINKLDVNEKKFVEKGKNDFIKFIVEQTNNSKPIKKTVFVKAINHFINRNNIDNKHMIFQMLSSNSSSIDFIKSFSSYVVNKSLDKEENLFAEKFFKKINSYNI